MVANEEGADWVDVEAPAEEDEQLKEELVEDDEYVAVGPTSVMSQQDLPQAIPANDALPPFHQACHIGNLEEVERLLQRADLTTLNAQDQRGWTPFFAACDGVTWK